MRARAFCEFFDFRLGSRPSPARAPGRLRSGPGAASYAARSLSVVLALGLMSATSQLKAQSFYEWYAVGFWDHATYIGYSAFSAAEVQYFIASFRGRTNASETWSDPGTCATPPTGLGQTCQFTTSYYVISSGASPTETDYMRSFTYGYWIEGTPPPRAEVRTKMPRVRVSTRPKTDELQARRDRSHEY
jgi:hypothetical protein